MLPFANRQISNLSGGQQQRVFLMRALAQESDVYFMDEPFAGVDAATETAIIALLHELREKGKTLMVVHHDLLTARNYFDQPAVEHACGGLRRHRRRFHPRPAAKDLRRLTILSEAADAAGSGPTDMCSRRKTLSKRLSWAAALGLLALGLLLPECAWAAKIGDVAEESRLANRLCGSCRSAILPCAMRRRGGALASRAVCLAVYRCARWRWLATPCRTQSCREWRLACFPGLMRAACWTGISTSTPSRKTRHHFHRGRGRRIHWHALRELPPADDPDQEDTALA